MWFTDLNCIPRGWSVTCQVVRRADGNCFSALSYRCLCPAHQENNYAPVEGALRNESFAQRLGRIMALATGDWVNEKPTIVCMHAQDNCLNPDAVAVKWYECAQCGRTRSETVKAEVW